MGAYLSKPVKEKIHEVGENESLCFASCTMQGWRIHQEDAHNCIPDFAPDISLFAVYDGHGGSEVSQYLSEHFPEFLKQKILLAEGDIVATLKHLFVNFDATLRLDDTIKLMSALKEVDLPNEPKEIDDSEEVERKEREALYDEAVALSKEAKIGLHKIIKEYMENAIAAEEMRGSKRPVTASSPQVPKRRKFNKSYDGDESTEHNNASTNGDVNKPDEDTSNTEMEVEGKILKTENKNSKDDSNENGNIGEKSQIDDQEDKQDKKSKATNHHASEAENLAADSASDLQQNRQTSSSDHEQKTDTSVSSTSNEADDDDEDDPDYKVEEDEENEDEDVDDEEAEEPNGNEGAEDDEESIDEEEEDSLDEEDISTLLHGAETGTKAGFDSGSTACLALIYKDRYVVANIGDSRAVLCRDGKAVDLSTDHKPEDEEEKKRIETAGGQVGEDGRVNGGLNLSRAFGDHFYKQKEELPLHEQMITSKPDVTITTRDKQKDDYLILACDGIWNQMSSEELCGFVSERINKMDLKQITAEICEHCCAPDTTGDGSGCDNETVILIDLKKNRFCLS